MTNRSLATVSRHSTGHRVCRPRCRISSPTCCVESRVGWCRWRVSRDWVGPWRRVASWWRWWRVSRDWVGSWRRVASWVALVAGFSRLGGSVASSRELGGAGGGFLATGWVCGVESRVGWCWWRVSRDWVGLWRRVASWLVLVAGFSRLGGSVASSRELGGAGGGFLATRWLVGSRRCRPGDTLSTTGRPDPEGGRRRIENASLGRHFVDNWVLALSPDEVTANPAGKGRPTGPTVRPDLTQPAGGIDVLSSRPDWRWRIAPDRRPAAG